MNRTLRVVAIVIAIAGAIDPAITVNRAVKPEIGIVASAHLPDPALTDRVTGALEARFTVIPGAPSGAAAIVSVGFQLPQDEAIGIAPAFAVIPEPRAPFVAITALDAPASAALHARVPIRVRVGTWAAQGRPLTVTLAQDDVVTDRVTTTIRADAGETSETVTVTMVAPAAGPMRARVTATVEGTDARAVADAAIGVAHERWPVLVYDGRPSWMSTFVRRAIESDPRFGVTSRVGTSRGVGAIAGRPPARLTAGSSLDAFGVIVIGAPEALSDRDADALDAFLRRTGGTVIALIDQPEPGRALARLTGVDEWREVMLDDPAGEPPATELLVPARMPLWAEANRTHAAAPRSGATDADADAATGATAAAAGDAPDADVPAAIWTTRVGRGRLIVSGVLDAWRYRDQRDAAFDRFWRSLVAESAARAAEGARPPAAATGATAASALARATPDDRALIATWTTAHGGAAFPESQISALVDRMVEVTQPPIEPRTVRPMRSPWWIAPFALALGTEWIRRRRMGQR